MHRRDQEKERPQSFANLGACFTRSRQIVRNVANGTTDARSKETQHATPQTAPCWQRCRAPNLREVGMKEVFRVVNGATPLSPDRPYVELPLSHC